MLAGLVFVCVWFATTASALTFDLTDGSKVEGEIILAKPDGLQIRREGNKYEKLEWSKFSQATLNDLKKDKKLAPYVEPYIEVPLDEKIKKTEVAIKEVPRLERPAKGSLLGAMFSSSIGIEPFAGRSRRGTSLMATSVFLIFSSSGTSM